MATFEEYRKSLPPIGGLGMANWVDVENAYHAGAASRDEEMDCGHPKACWIGLVEGTPIPVPEKKFRGKGMCEYCGSQIGSCEAGDFCTNKNCGYVDGWYNQRKTVDGHCTVCAELANLTAPGPCGKHSLAVYATKSHDGIKTRYCTVCEEVADLAEDRDLFVECYEEAKKEIAGLHSKIEAARALIKKWRRTAKGDRAIENYHAEYDVCADELEAAIGK